MNYNRRKFIKSVAATASLIPFSGVQASKGSIMETGKYQIYFFTKLLDKYEPGFMAETLAMAGIEGFDLTVRPGGRVEPERVEDDLPGIIEIGKKYGIRTGMMVTAIRDTTDPFAGEVLKVASENGIKHYRLGYYDYDYQAGVWETLRGIKDKLKRLAWMNQSLGIQAGYQNHAGTRVGGPMWDVWELIRELPPEWMSSQFDVRHAAVEGSSSWIVSMRLLSGHIGSLAIKDFSWEISGGKAVATYEPLGEGLVDFDLYFKTLRELNVVAPITLHIEYPLLEKEEEQLPLLQQQKIIVSKVKKDLDFIKSNLMKHQLI
jgi:sugar phosphate isomerase/epimerase